MALCARELSSIQFARFTTLWSAIYVVSGTLLGALEPELARLYSEGRFGDAVRSLRFAGYLLATCIMSFWAIRLFENLDLGESWTSEVLLPSLILLAMFGEVVGRGFLAGGGKTTKYGLVAPIDATTRLFMLLLISVTVGVTLNSSLLAMAFGSLVAAAFSVAAVRRIGDHDDSSSNDFRKSNLLHLMATTAGMTVVVSGVPLASHIFLSPDSEVGAGIGAAVLTARIPLLLVMGFESVLVGDFRRRLEQGAQVRLLARRIAATATALGFCGFVVGYFAGLLVTRIVAGNIHGATRLDLGIFGLGTGLCLGALMFAPLLIVNGQHGRLSTIWTLAASAMCVLMALGANTILTAGLGFVLANLTALAGMGFAGSRGSRHQ